MLYSIYGRSVRFPQRDPTTGSAAEYRCNIGYSRFGWQQRHHRHLGFGWNGSFEEVSIDGLRQIRRHAGIDMRTIPEVILCRLRVH